MMLGGESLSVAFMPMGGVAWTVGPVYLKNLIRALRLNGATHLGLCVPTSLTPSEAGDYAAQIGVERITRYGLPRRGSPEWISGVGWRRLAGVDPNLAQILRTAGVNVLFSPSIGHRYPGIATLGWLADLQHEHLPELFTSAERAARNQSFRHTLARSTRVVVMSDAVAADIRSFAPEFADKVHVLRPVAEIPTDLYNGDPCGVVRRYNVPERFVYLPNQFWAHKGHLTVFHAVARLKEMHPDLHVICTGSPHDYRRPEHFANVWRHVAELGLHGNVTYLGLVPREDVLDLIRASVAVVNPSRYEGWGYSVEEARSVGKQVLVSDLPVHREQNHPHSTYFDPHDADDLAAKLSTLWTSTPAGPDLELERQARDENRTRMLRYGAAFIDVANEALASAWKG